jgi:ABC-2 type transport system permease protein
LALLVGAMMADFFRIMAQATLVLLIALATGLSFETGVAGAVVLILIASLFGIAYSGLGFAIALKTGNAQATQSMWFLFMPLMFMTTLFAPKEALSGWLSAAATVNPMTYILQGMRSLSLEGWNAEDIGVALLAICVLGGVCMSAAFMALKSRVR